MLLPGYHTGWVSWRSAGASGSLEVKNRQGVDPALLSLQRKSGRSRDEKPFARGPRGGVFCVRRGTRGARRGTHQDRLQHGIDRPVCGRWQDRAVGFQDLGRRGQCRGRLLGRPVKLVYYDDQSNPSLVPGIYTKLIDIDQVDLLISSYGTNLVVPAMPVAISHNRMFFGLFALAANDKFHYPKYFSMLPFGPEPVKTFAEGWFDLAAAQSPKPKTVAIVATDAEFQHKAAESAREHAKARGIDIVYDRAYPPTTVDFTPIIRSVQAAQPDLVYIASYPSDTVGILRS